MKASSLIAYILTIVILFNFVFGLSIRKPVRALSTFDLPDQGFYYGFVVNKSSHFVEIRIISTRDKRQIYSQVLPPPSSSSNKRYFQYSRYQKENKDAYHLPHVIPLWLELGRYTVSIRHRDDLFEKGSLGQWVSSVVILDKDFIEKLPGPFTLEIEDDQ
jgi:hypothetical protein